jgi:hypothetical protein
MVFIVHPAAGRRFVCKLRWSITGRDGSKIIFPVSP